MRIWVCGATGKLGSRVAERLRESGHQVTGAASLEGCQAIIHCAAIASPEGIEPAELDHQPTAGLLRRYCPETELRVELPGWQGAYAIGRARELIGWQPQ